MTINQKICDDYAIYHGDNVEVMSDIPDNSIHLTVTSTPFSGLYQFTDSIRDSGNVLSDEEFWTGIGFMLKELYRIMMPGRLACFHCMDVPATITHDGYIGLKDFSGDTVRNLQKQGFIYHSKVVIWKDPLVAATRTHAIGLAHKELVKDSAISRQGIPDYLIVVRKPGDNPEPITHLPSGLDRWIGEPEDEPKREKKADPAINKYSHECWQAYASPVWMDINMSDTYQFRSAREDDDSKHIAPLQKTVIRRAIELWSRPGDIVFDPFAGIGSSLLVALEEGRRGVGCELKESYWGQAVRNLDATLEKRTQLTLDLAPADDIADSIAAMTPAEIAMNGVADLQVEQPDWLEELA
jgi:DNA modification methylase